MSLQTFTIHTFLNLPNTLYLILRKTAKHRKLMSIIFTLSSIHSYTYQQYTNFYSATTYCHFAINLHTFIYIYFSTAYKLFLSFDGNYETNQSASQLVV